MNLMVGDNDYFTDKREFSYNKKVKAVSYKCDGKFLLMSWTKCHSRII